MTYQNASHYIHLVNLKIDTLQIINSGLLYLPRFQKIKNCLALKQNDFFKL